MQSSYCKLPTCCGWHLKYMGMQKSQYFSCRHCFFQVYLTVFKRDVAMSRQRGRRFLGEQPGVGRFPALPALGNQCCVKEHSCHSPIQLLSVITNGESNILSHNRIHRLACTHIPLISFVLAASLFLIQLQLLSQLCLTSFVCVVLQVNLYLEVNTASSHNS